MPVDGVHQNGDVGNVQHDGEKDAQHDGDGDVHLRMEIFIPISNVKGTTPIMRQLMLRMTIQQ